jgi:asparagine synthase (glutamine-hydrolysing)
VAMQMPTLNTTGNELPVREALDPISADFAVRLHSGGNIEVTRGAVQHEYQGFRLLLVGDCLLSTADRAARFAVATAAANLDRIADWPGSFSAVVLSPERITAYSDLAGQFPLYYSRRGGELLISTDPHPVAIAHDRGPDAVTAAIHITCSSALPMWSTRTAYRNVEQIAGGAVMQVDTRSLRLQLDTTRLPLPTEGRPLADGAAELRDALVAAVRSRSEGRFVSADFSGGFDSTSIAFLAARYSSQPVTAINYHQPLAPAEDMVDAARFAALDQQIALSVVRGSADTLPFTSLAGPAGAGTRLSPEPSPGALAARRTALRLATAAASGARVHLTGEGGDALLLTAPSYLARLARPRHARTLLRHCASYGRLRYVSPARLAARAVRLARTDASRALTALAAELEHPSGRTERWQDLISWWPPAGEAATWLTASMRRELAGIAADPETARAVPLTADAADLSTLTSLRRSGQAQRHLRELAQSAGIPAHAPFLDSSVITAALSVPAETRADPRSYKPLLQAALGELVPTEVFGRRTKGNYAAEDYLGARNASQRLRSLLRDSRLAALGVIEPGALDATINRMLAGVAVPLGPLNMLLATETWLRSADQVQTGELLRC